MKVVYAVAVVCLASSLLGAQEQKPPRWGVEASPFYSSNLLFFKNKSVATLIGVQASLSHDENGGTFSSSSNGTSGYINVAIGRRWYRDIEKPARAFAGLSLVGGVGSGTTDRFYSIGPSLGFGMVYFFSDHVSLGAQEDMAATYRYNHSTFGSSSAHQREWRLDLLAPRLTGAVYF